MLKQLVQKQDVHVQHVEQDVSDKKLKVSYKKDKKKFHFCFL
jgi:hypothetical protein